jgi:hypothetical protein
MAAFFDSLGPEVVWGLYIRGLGVVLFISFASLTGQLVWAAGRDGGMPIYRRLAKIKDDFPTWRRFYYFPTLLWVHHSDRMLRLLPIVGMAASGCVIYGGHGSFWALLTCYLTYLTLDMVGGLIFPWDCLCFESIILSLFLPETLALPHVATVAAPAPAIAWAIRLLVFRVMFGFGKQKFAGATSKDWSYLKGFLVAQPLPSPLGWYIQKLPAALLKPMVVFMFFAEIPAPFFVFFPGDLSIVCAFTTIFLMIGIQAMGSFGYFSLLTIVGCIPLFDSVTPRQLVFSTLFSPGAPVFTNAYVLLHTAAVLLAFPFNSWLAQSYHLWSVWWRLPRALQLPFDFLRFMHPFRWMHPYGVFPPNTGPGVKMSLLVEVTWDKETWHETTFNYSPTNEMSPPKFVSPYHPRGDQAVIYETFGLNPTSLISSLLGPWDPFSYGAQPAAKVLLQRIVEGKDLDFIKGLDRMGPGKPPLMARITTVMLEPAPIKEHLATGKWWKRTYIGPHAAPQAKDPRFWQDILPEPEMWHFDAIFWRRRSKLNDLILRSQAGKEDPMELAIAQAGDLGKDQVERFWNELVPMLAPPNNVALDNLGDIVPVVHERFDAGERRAFQRLLGRFSLLLVARLEPLYLGLGRKPKIPAKTYFHLWMLTQHIICKGKDAYLAAMANPISVAEELPSLTPHTGLFALGIFRFDSMVFEAQKLRLISSISAPHDEEEKKRIEYSTASMSKFEQRLAKIMESVSGFVSVFPHIRGNLKGPKFDHGYPELYPTFKQLDSGEVVLKAYKERPDPVAMPPGHGAPAE